LGKEVYRVGIAMADRVVAGEGHDYQVAEVAVVVIKVARDLFDCHLH